MGLRDNGGVAATRVLLIEPNEGCLTIARRLAPRGVPVVALVSPRSAWTAASKHVRGVHLGPLPDDADSWVRALVDLADRPGVLLPGSDVGSAMLRERRGDLPPILRSYEHERSAHPVLMDKDRCYELADRLGIPTPWRVRFDTPDDLVARLDSVRYPCIAKPVLRHVGGRQTIEIDDRETLEREVGPALEAGVPMLVTALIPGPDTALEGVVCIRDEDGGYPLLYTRRKIRQHPNHYGIGSLVESIDAPECAAFGRRLLDGAGFVGLAAVEFKRHGESGELLLIEVNVRVPQTFGLGQACRADAPWRLYRHLDGKPLGPQSLPRFGRKVWFPELDVRVIQGQLRRGELTVLQALGSLRGVDDLGAFSVTDPGPSFALVRTKLRRRRSPSAA